MKRLVFAVIMTLILCVLTILNIPKEPTLTTTIGTSNNTIIEVEEEETDEDTGV